MPVRMSTRRREHKNLLVLNLGQIPMTVTSSESNGSLLRARQPRASPSSLLDHQRDLERRGEAQNLKRS